MTRQPGGSIASHPYSMPDSGTNVSTSTKLLASGLALAVALVVCATAATVTLSSEISRKRDRTASAPDITALERETFRDRGTTAALIDSLLAPLGPLPDAPPELVAAVAAFVADDTMPARVWEASASDVLTAPRHLAPWPMLSIEAALTSMSPTQLVEAAADTNSHEATVFRRWARSRPLPPMWGYRAGLPGVQNIAELPGRNPAYLRALFATNDDATLLLLRDGNNVAAMDRARESLAASRHLLEQPRLTDALLGARFARRAAQLLAVAAARSNDSATTAQATRLDSLAEHSHPDVRQWIAQEQADANSTVAVQVSSNKELMPALRIEAMYPIVMGGCRNIREVVFGFSNARRNALNRAALAVEDIPRSGELAAMYQSLFDALTRDAEVQAQKLRATTGSKSRHTVNMDWIVPPSVRARIALCNAWG
jgi:hypothetical protein